MSYRNLRRSLRLTMEQFGCLSVTLSTLLRENRRFLRVQSGRMSDEQLERMHEYDRQLESLLTELYRVVPGLRSCRRCFCNEFSACVDEGKQACHWVEIDLCSNCAAKEEAANVG